MSRPIALMTDFGTHDIYIGAMKGVIASICPDARVLDITHHIPPHHVRAAAFNLMNVYQYFPPDAVFVVVVDPGVGSARRPIAVQVGGRTFVAPDNGILSYVLAEGDGFSAVTLDKPGYQLVEISNTFHGRDIFSPVAAHLACGAALETVGTPHEVVQRLPVPELSQTSTRMIRGEVVHIDRFGNVITSIGRLRWQHDERLRLVPALGSKIRPVPISAPGAHIRVNNHTIYAIRRAYSEALRGDVVALVGSAGFLEIAVNQGSAQDRLDISVGDLVEVHLGDIDAAIRD